MLRSFHAELQKAHRRHDLLLCLLVPLIMILWVGGLAPSDPEELANGYSALLYSIPVIEAILMPVLMAVLASRLWEIEVKGSMPKLLYTLQERRSLFAGKAAFGLLEILLVTLLEMGAAVLLGIVHGYTAACLQARRSLECWRCCWSRCWSWPVFRCWGVSMVIPKPFPLGSWSICSSAHWLWMQCSSLANFC